VGAYLIIYRADRKPIEIVAVTQGGRDIPAFLHRIEGSSLLALKQFGYFPAKFPR